MRKHIGKLYWKIIEAFEPIRLIILEIKIVIKFIFDCCKLPLTTKHWHLYRIIHTYYFRVFHRFPDLIRCPDFNDKIQWLKLFDQNPLAVDCSDKIKIREFIEYRIGKDHLVKLYQTCKSFNAIDFENLPDSFVIKTNHDAGTVILVRDKKAIDLTSVKYRIEASLQRTYGKDKGEWGYGLINPQILVEEFIEPGRTMPPPDYKFHCVDGVVKYLHYIYDRGGDTHELFFTRDGSPCEFSVYFPKGDIKRYERPAAWNKLIELAEKLSSGFRYVRVDFFVSGQNNYAGEMTFWPMGGYYKGEGQKILGKALDFDRTKVSQLVGS